ncbi:MAG: type I secretion system permease/ATPase, partial [Achromobacter pulmonis]
MSRPAQVKTALDSLAWALSRLAAMQGTALDPMRLRSGLRLCEAAPLAIGQLELLCRHLGVDAPQLLAAPDPAHLPLLCHLQDDRWGIVTELAPGGDWTVDCGTGAVMVAGPALADRCMRLRLAEAPSGA